MRNPNWLVTLGIATSEPTEVTEVHRCVEYGCKCIVETFMLYEDVTIVGNVGGEAETYADALAAASAVASLFIASAPNAVAAVSANDGTGMSFIGGMLERGDFAGETLARLEAEEAA